MEIKKVIELADFFKKHAKTYVGLAAAEILFIITNYTLKSSVSNESETSEILRHLFFVGPALILGAWYLFRNIEKLKLFSEARIAVAISTDELSNTERILEVISPIITKLQRNRNLKFVSVVLLEPNLYATHHDAGRYLEKNIFKIDNILWLKIEIGNVGNVERFIISEGYFWFKNVPNEIFFHGIKVRLQDEIAFLNATSPLNCIDIKQYLEKKYLKHILHDLILYYLGVHCLCKGKFYESLRILREIFYPNDQYIKPELNFQTNQKAIKIKPENFVAARLANLLSKIYGEVSAQYYRTGKLKAAYTLCLQAEHLFQGREASYWILVQLARLSYELGRIEDAKHYTKKMEEVAQRQTDEVVLNFGFFSILNKDIDSLIRYYKKLNPESLSCQAMDVVSFLNDYAPKSQFESNMISYATGILTTYYLDETIGKEQLRQLLNAIDNDNQYTKMRRHIDQVLRKSLDKKKRRS